MNTTTIILNGKTYVIPNDRLPQVISVLEQCKVTDNPTGHFQEVLLNRPFNDGRTLING